MGPLGKWRAQIRVANTLKVAQGLFRNRNLGGRGRIQGKLDQGRAELESPIVSKGLSGLFRISDAIARGRTLGPLGEWRAQFRVANSLEEDWLREEDETLGGQEEALLLPLRVPYLKCYITL